MSHPCAALLMVFITLLQSTAGVVTRHLDTAGSFEVTFWRSTAMAVSLSVFLSFIDGKRFWSELLRPTKLVLVSGICWSIMFSAFMVALTLTSVANVLVIMALSPLFTAISARIFLNHRLPVITWFAIIVAGFGIAWMFADDGNTSLSLTGSFVSLAIPIAMAINFTFLQFIGMREKSNVASDGKRPYEMQQALLIGALISSCVTLLPAWPLQTSLHDITLLSMLGIFQLAVPWLLVIYVGKVLSAPEISLLSLLEIVFGVTWAWLWAGEALSLNTLVGGVLVLGALFTNVLATIVMKRKTFHFN